MGAEQSNESKRKDDEKYQRMMKSALEQQRKMYEAKCKELLQEQQKAAAAKLNVVQDSTRVNPPQTINTPLYPNLRQVPANVNMQPSTSNVYYQAQTSNTLKQIKPLERPLQNVPLVSQATHAVASNFQQNSNIVSATSSPTYKTNPTTNYHASAPTAPEPSAVSQQKHKSNIRNKKKNGQTQCPSCKINRLEINIFQCQKGHSSCSQCKANGVTCGICMSVITNTRNIDLERFIANLQQNTESAERITCPNKSDGCRLSFKEEKMEDHLKECVFREMDCPVASALDSQCFWRGKINQIPAHFIEYHPNETRADVDTEMFFAQNKSYEFHHVAIGNFNFLVHLKLDSDLQTFFMTVQLIGSLVSAAKWTYEFHVYDKSEPRRKYVYTDKCLPNTIHFRDISKESKCATLPLRHALSFFKNNKMSYKFYINRNESKPNQRGQGRAGPIQSNT